jgi:transposase-like protein
MSLKKKVNLKRREYTEEFKLKVLAEVEAGIGLAQVARKYQVHPNTIRTWRRQARKYYKDRAFAGRGKAYTDEARIAELQRMVGRLTMENEMIIRDHIQWIALEWPSYGYRMITAELGRRYKTEPVNHKRVLQMMREDNLLCLRKHRRFIVTPDSRHSYRIYPNLAEDFTPTGLNQLWVSDITYIRIYQ